MVKGASTGDTFAVGRRERQALGKGQVLILRAARPWRREPCPLVLRCLWGASESPFVDDMIALIERELCIDRDRLFAMGFNYGGGMSYAIACARADVFRAVAVYAGMQLSGCDGGDSPIAYMGIHSVNDPTCRYSAGEGCATRS